MKKFISLTFYVLFSIPGFCQKNKYALEFAHLKDNFYVYVSYGTYNGEKYPANAMYLITKKGVILFDTPWDEQYYQPLLDSIWARHHQKVIMCIATHFHTYRTGGLKYYRSRGIKTYTTHQTDSLCSIHHDNRAQYLVPQDTTFHIGGYEFETFYAGPGHTMDNIEILFPKERILYSGCFIKSVEDKTLGNLDDADVKNWGQSIQKLREKFPNPEFVICGHNDWHNKNSIQHTLNMVIDFNKSHR
jgi:metallo-beta-lactamase class B